MKNRLKSTLILITILLTIGSASLFADNPILSEQEEKTLVTFQNAFRKVAEAVRPVVVEVNVVNIVRQPAFNGSSPFEFFFRQPDKDKQPQTREYRAEGLGSGVIVRENGDTIYVLTNNHVVGNADSIRVTLHDGRSFNSTLVGKDPRKDLALIKFETKEEIPMASLGDSDSVLAGDWVVAVGNPMGFESTVTAGIVSAVGRESIPQMGMNQLTDYIQTDAAINQGNSGGALVNIKGEVIGINTWIASNSGGNIGLGFAIPINNAKKAIDDFILKGRVEYGWLGVNIGDPGNDVMEELRLDDNKGAFVYDIFIGSPADKAGIVPGDLITHVDGKTVKSSSDLVNMVANLPPGRTTRFSVIRQGEKLTLTVKPAVREENVETSTSSVWPGMVVLPITDEIRERLDLDKRKGDVVIGNIREGSPASSAGLQSGDIIQEINGRKIRDLEDFYEAMKNHGAEDHMLKIYRQGNEFIIGLVKK